MDVLSAGDLTREFERTFGRAPRVYRAPGRVNLIGEHTDYNDGFVMPMALDRSTWVAAAPRTDRALVVASREYRETITLDLDCHPPYPTESWIDYVRGIAAVLGTGGADIFIASDVPIGAGLSSSAALEIACGYALLDLAGMPIDLDALARAGQRAEHEFVGIRCGIMDQMIACHGETGGALFLDTRTLQHRSLPLPATLRVVVGNTMVHHELASSEYNARRADCEAGVQTLSSCFPHVRALRDASLPELEDVRGRMPDRVYRRCRHVITENARVEEAADALVAGDFVRFGRLMDQSHYSLRADYEVTCAELDAMSAIARELDGVYGARMTGGGFGGCIVALADASRVDAIEVEVRTRYEAATGRRADVWVCTAGAGVSRVK
jgi:galactokinase